MVEYSPELRYSQVIYKSPHLAPVSPPGSSVNPSTTLTDLPGLGIIPHPQPANMSTDEKIAGGGTAEIIDRTDSIDRAKNVRHNPTLISELLC